MIPLPQICTQAKELTPRIIEGRDFVAIEQRWNYRLAAPGKQTGSEWRQTLVFPKDKRYFFSSDRILSRNSGEALFFRQDMPGHIRHGALPNGPPKRIESAHPYSKLCALSIIGKNTSEAARRSKTS